MAASEKDERPTSLEERVYSGQTSRAFTTWTRKMARTFPINSNPSEHGKESLHYISPLRRRPSRGNTNNLMHVNSNNDIVFQPPQSLSDEGDSRYAGTSRLSESGHLGMCDDPYCMTCPTHIKSPQGQTRQFDTDAKIHHATDGGAKGWKNIFCSSYSPCIPRIMNPHSKYIRKWNKFIIISCLISIFIDPLFFFLLYANEDNKCIVLNWTMTKTIVVLRSVTDVIYFLHILLQFRLAYIAPESRVVGAGDLVDDPKKIALHYLSGNFILDIFVALPLPQTIILIILPATMGATGANYAKNVLRIAILVQYIPRLYRFLPMLVGLSPNGLILESAWANFIMNLLTFMLASHVVGSCWYLFGLQRLNQCLRDACHSSNVTGCTRFIDCGHVKDYLGFKNDPMWNQWRKNKVASGCFDQSNFAYGIYQNAINLTTRPNIILRYVYSLFWGFQQISTLAGNQVPSYFVWEVLFTMAIIGIGLLLFALLIGNMQNFLQSLGRRRLERSLRSRNIEQWMSHRRLPEELRRQVREAERFSWAATRGINEEEHMVNLPEDLRRDIRRHLFKFVKKVRIFQLLDEPIIDAICERLRTKTYIKGSKILCQGGLLDKMVFIIRGKMQSIVEGHAAVPLSEGDVCGEELLTWCLEHPSADQEGRRIRFPGFRLLSNRLVECLTNVEAFVIRAADLEEVTNCFSRCMKIPRVQRAIRYESPYWRTLAARRIQLVWRYRRNRLNGVGTSELISAA